MWNSLPNAVVKSDTINTFKNRLDKHWSNQEVLFDFNADLTNWRSTSLYINVVYRDACIEDCAHLNSLDWIGYSEVVNSVQHQHLHVH